MNPTEVWNIVSAQYSSITEKYMTAIMLGGLVFCLLNCFMGYKLRKIWGSILGLILGAAAGGGLGYYYLHDTKYAAAIGVAGAVVIAAMAWLFYKLGIFVLCTGLVYMLTVSFFSAPDSTNRIICAVVGIFAATLALGYEQYVIIGITGICGGIGAVNLLFDLTGMDTGMGTWILGLILAFLGIAVQAAPLLRDREKRRRTDSFPGNRRRARKWSLPSLPGRRKKVKKKTVYKKENSRTGKDSGSTDKKGTGKNTNSERTRRESGKNLSDENLQSKKQDIRERENTGYGQSAYMGVDMDDLSRELSQEIQKIYQDD